jgi:tRNA(Ile)-lysidine synthase
MNPPDSVLVSRVERIIHRQRLFKPGDTLIVALSGGADSTALLDLLSRLAGFNLNLIAAHVNHCLRGAESDADQEFCQASASRYAIPFEVRRVDVRSLASENRLNLEDAGRQARIEFLDEVRGKYGAAAVVLAHHADDQAETVLMRLLRGSGMTGLSGMAYRNARGYVRPLLEITRSEIEQYLRRRSLEWHEDASNNDKTYLRNRIRHELLPLLEEYNPAIRSCLCSTASILRGDDTLLSELTQRAAAESYQTVDGMIVCSVRKLRSLDPALRQRVLRHVFKQLAASLEGVNLHHIDAVCDLIESDRPNSQLALPHGVTAVRVYDRIVLTQTALRLTSTSFDTAGFELQITGPGYYQLPDYGSITVEPVETVAFPANPDTTYFDLIKTPFPWLVRTFRPGDRIQPFGMTGRKKVKNIFIDRKIPLAERRRIPLLFCDAELFWIAGVCASELCRIDTSSATPVQVSWYP